MNKKQPLRIAIIGGGILGLTLTYLLTKKKYKGKYLVTLIENSDDLGGLASSYKIGKSNLEKFYHHFFKSDVNIQSLLKELGIKDKIMWIPSKMGLYNGKNLYKFSHALDILRFPALNIIERIRLGIVSFYLQKIKNKDFSKISAIDWCNEHFGKNITSIIWEPLLRSKFEDYYDKVSMEFLYTRIHDRSSSRPFPILDERLGYIKGGFNEIVSALEKRIKAQGGNIFVGTHIEKYQFINSKHRLSFNNKKRYELYDIVISTVSPSGFIKLFKPKKEYVDKLKKIEFLGAYCFIVRLDRSISPYYWTSVNDPKAPFVALVEHTNFIDKKRYDGSHIVYLGKYTKNDSQLFSLNEDQLWKLCFKYLKRIDKKLKPKNILSRKLFKAPYAQHIVDIKYKPLSYRTDKKGLLFAHFSQIYPHDRGTNYAILQAYDIVNFINKRKWN